MPKILKPSGERGTSWLSGPVKRARVRLTGVYVALLALVLVATGLATRVVFDSHLQRRFMPQPPVIAELPNGDLAVLRPTRDDVRQDLLDTLLVVNLLSFFGSVALAYWLAGLTLRPVEAAALRERRFVSHASHELRTPLAILQAEMETNALDAPDGEKTRITSYLEEVDRLRRLTDALLDQQKTTPVLEDIALSDFLQTEIARVAEAAKERNITLLPLNVPKIRLQTIPVQLSIVLQNLLQNAIRYNKPGGTVEVAAHQQKEVVQIIVKDNGLGIPAADLPHVTERFYRVQRAQPSGTGLGLTITKEIVEELGGLLEVRSTEGEGTEVIVTIPLLRHT